jgi:Skp family chaperone for outer membrane proteins
VKKLVFTLTLAAGLCGAFVWLPVVCGQNNSPATRAARPAGPSRIAFVDMRQILENYKKGADVLQTVKASEEDARAKLGQMLTEGQQLEKPLLDGTLVRDTPQYDERQEKVKQLAKRAQTAKIIAEQELKQQKARVMISVYRDVIDAVRQFAEQNRYDLVLQVDREAVAAKSYRMIEQTMAQAIICRDNRDDLTDEIVAWLNHQYTSADAAANSAAPPAAQSPSSKTSSPAAPATKGRKAPAR